jgi:prevent-host-death family protein
MAQVDIKDADGHLSGLLSRVAGGEEIVLAESGRPVARLIPFRPRRQRILGQDKGLFKVPDDFDAPLPDEILDSFE